MKHSPSEVRVTTQDTPRSPAADLAAYRWLLQRLFAKERPSAHVGKRGEGESGSNTINAIVAQEQGACNG